jgi:redox-sensitive bicupin YhaK (pirin superfamily)
LGTGRIEGIIAFPGRRLYVAPLKGTIIVNGQAASAGDGIAVMDEDHLRITAEESAEIILVEKL